MAEKEAEKKLKDAVYEAVNEGFFFDEIFQIVTKALNEYRKGHKSEKDDN